MVWQRWDYAFLSTFTDLVTVMLREVPEFAVPIIYDRNECNEEKILGYPVNCFCEHDHEIGH